MSQQYERYRPKPLNRKMSIFWFLKRKPYLLFIIREMTSLFVAAYAVILLIKLNAIRQGPEAWEGLLASLSTPFSVILHTIILLFILFHTFTWFNLAPTATVLKVGKKKVPDGAIITANYVMWIVLSIGIGWIILMN